MRPLVLSLLEIRHETIHDVRLWGQEVERIDIMIRRPSFEDLLDIWSKSGEGQRLERGTVRASIVLVMFSFMIVSSSSTLSRMRRLSGSTTRTFHCKTGSC